MELNRYSPEVVTAVCKIDDVKRQAEDALNQAKDLVEASEKTIKICDKLNGICAENEVNFYEFSSESRALEKLIFKMKDVVFNLYKIVFTVLTWNEQRLMSNAIIEDYLEYSKKIEGITATVCNENLMVRLPVLSTKQGRWKRINGNNISLDNNKFFVESLEGALGLIDHEIPLLGKKNIMYMFVYNSQRKHIVDSDNYDTKSITDVICSRTIGGDSAQNCSFFYISVCDEELPEGTYITVSPGFGKIPDLNSILTAWKHLI